MHSIIFETSIWLLGKIKRVITLNKVKWIQLITLQLVASYVEPRNQASHTIRVWVVDAAQIWIENNPIRLCKQSINAWAKPQTSVFPKADTDHVPQLDWAAIRIWSAMKLHVSYFRKAVCNLVSLDQKAKLTKPPTNSNCLKFLSYLPCCLKGTSHTQTRKHLLFSPPFSGDYDEKRRGFEHI